MPAFVPSATYRLQFSNDFGFAAATELIPYLRNLGITHVYASPFLRARKGSTHGYDVVDHNQIDPQFGGEADFNRLSAALAEADMGLILDFVPNHMGVGHADNAWWLDVLEWGPHSSYARFFDIDWRNLPGRSRPAVILPLLGKPYGQALAEGELRLGFDPAEGSFLAWYFDHRLPVRPSDYLALLQELRITDVDLTRFQRRRRELASDRELAAEMKAILATSPTIASRIEAALTTYNSSPHLHRLLLRQHYMLAYWRSSVSEINYRRFFDINDLAGLRMEDDEVFAATHKLVWKLVQEGQLQGLRLDHIDGLYDPARYCRTLGELVGDAGAKSGEFYILVEKILGEDEGFPRLPNVAGTTGYEWLNTICRLLVSNKGLLSLEEAWRDFTGETRSYIEMEQAAKAETISGMFSGELETLVRLLRRIAAGNRRSQDFTADQLRTALLAYVSALPVYRTYVTPEEGASAQDRSVIDAAVDMARKSAPRVEPVLFDFLHDLLTLDILKPECHGYSFRRARLFVGKLQQFTGPVMAKALEDTCFYRHFRLLSLNEVGGHPDGDGLDPKDFHVLMEQRIRQQPHGLTATATHDTERGEDARLRIAALSELSEEWRAAVQRWRRWNQPFVAGGPSPGHQYMLYQALLGAWPLSGPDDGFVARAVAYTIKAAREGKRETSWHYPDTAYEAALEDFLRGILDASRSAEFLVDFASMAHRVALLGSLNGLSQAALKLLMPGVPDIYQGTELWDLSFVDPDNRRPVDFGLRKKLQKEMHDEIDWPALVSAWPDGRIKFALLQALLRMRKAQADMFLDGDYQPLSVKGKNADRVLAFSRNHGGSSVIVAVGRVMAGITEGGRRWPLGQDWGDTTIDLPEGRLFRDMLRSGGVPQRELLPLSEGFRDFPVAVLMAAG